MERPGANTQQRVAEEQKLKCEKLSLGLSYTQTVNTDVNLLSSFQSDGSDRESNVLLLAYDKH